MSIRVLSNCKDDMATIYQSCTDWSFGPVIYTSGKMSAAALAEKFIEWADLRRRGPFEDWSDKWLEGKWSEFQALNWKECPKCYGGLIPGKNEACQDCLEEALQ